eukprot:CAMPEP_0195650712 /NCGR_PEP_ID=MMETSP0815-20121206/31866_1 /TAXON_ID=97485 /ORGANISM="Prymnesium parvum, Strain Texoma1" /LENGTH=75 /DNA_ID=CAMNT_0040794541 /DNA_START=877 /DNA_END=1104 /DNA_ORIENTATION=-
MTIVGIHPYAPIDSTTLGSVRNPEAPVVRPTVIRERIEQLLIAKAKAPTVQLHAQNAEDYQKKSKHSEHIADRRK